MQRNGHGPERAAQGSRVKQGLLARARARTDKEHAILSSPGASHYAAGALNQSPYIAMPGGVVVVRRKGCWAC